MLKNNNNLFYIMTVFLNMDVQRSIFVLYLLQIGFSHGEIGLFQSILFFVNVALEVPSGIFADKYGRKSSLLLGFAGLAINGLGFILFSSFVPFLILFGIYGASIAMTSGSDRALLYDNLVVENREEDYAKILSFSRAIGSFSLGISIIFGAFLYENWSWNVVYITFAVSKLLGAVFAIFLPELKFDDADKNHLHINDEEKSEITPSTSSSLIAFFKSDKGTLLLPLFFGYALFESATIPLYIFAQDLFASINISVPMISIAYIAVEIMTSIMFLLSSKVSYRFSLLKIAFVTTIVVTILLLILSLNISSFITVVSFLIIMSLPAFYEASYETYVNEKIDSQIRASCLSVSNLINSTMIGISYFIFGNIVDSYGFSVAIWTVSFISLFSLLGVNKSLLIKPFNSKE